MLHLLRSVWNTRRDRTGVRPTTRRPCVEELEDRAVPSSFASMLHMPGQGEIRADMVRVNANLQSLTRALSGSSNTNATGDLKTIQTDLNTLSKDVLAGKDTTTDVTTLLADQSQLASDLNTGSSPLSPRVQAQLANLDRSLLKLSTDLSQSGGTLTGGQGQGNGHGHGHGQGDNDDDNHGGKGGQGDNDDDNDDNEGGKGGQAGNLGTSIAQALDIRTDISAVNSSVKSLTTALGDIATTDPIKTDLSTVTGDLSTIQTNLTNAAPLDLTDLNNDVGTLKTDLGSVSGGIPSAAQTQLNTLIRVLTDVTNDVNQFTNSLQAQVTGAQTSLTRLTDLLGSNVSDTVKGDLTALDTALTTLATDLTSGTPLASDLTTALQDELTLVTDLGTPLPKGARGTLTSIASDLLGLGVASLI